MKQPMRLTASVPHGKNVLHEVFISVEMMYRIAPPMKLPMPTMNMDFSILGECIGVMSVRPRWGRESGRGFCCPQVPFIFRYAQVFCFALQLE